MPSPLPAPSSSGAPRDLGGRWEVLGWMAALVLLRGACVASLADVFFFGEELEKGAVAKAILDGVDVAHHQRSFRYFEGGGFVVAHLKSLSFLLFGQSLLANKLCALTCVLVFGAFWRLVDHHLGRRAARLAAAFFLLGPDSFQRYSLLSVGSHFEAMAFGLVVLDEGLRLILDPLARPTRRRLVLVGTIAGFGVYFGYQNALIVGWVGLLVLVRRPRLLLSRDGLYALLGFVLGLAPLLFMATRVGRQVLDIHGTDLSNVRWSLERARGYVSSVYAGRSAGELIPLVLYPLAAVLGSALALTARRRRVALVIAGYLVLWVGLWAFGPFLPDEHRHWFAWLRTAPLVLCLMVLVAAGLVSAAQRPGWRPLAQGLSVALLALGAVNAARLLTEGLPASPLANLRLLASTKGYDYRGYFGIQLRHLESRQPRHVRPMLGFQEPQRELLYGDLAARLFDGRRRDLTIGQQLAQLEDLDPGGRADFARGLGISVVARTRGDVGRALDSIAAIEEPLRSTLAEALGYFGADYASTRPIVLADVALAQHAGEVAAPFLRGVGARAFRALVVSPGVRGPVLDVRAVRALLEAQAPDAVPHLLSGFDAERARWTLPR